MNQTEDLKVFVSNRDSTCAECHEQLGRQAWVFLAGEHGAFCLACADLDHLSFLPAGNAALTRRAKKHSRLHAVVLKWSRGRKRYERQGLLVEEEALAKAETECLADDEGRRRQRARNALRRAEADEQYVARFAQRIREVFPGCPPNRERVIAEFACRKYSGRVGRSAAAKQLDADSVRLAVISHVRHAETDYDTLLGRNVERHDARRRVRARIEQVLASWEQGDADVTT